MAAVSVIAGFPGLWPDELCVKQMGRKVIGVCSVVLFKLEQSFSAPSFFVLCNPQLCLGLCFLMINYL